MKSVKCALLFVSAFILTQAFSQTAKNNITVGEKVSMYSKVLGEKREVWVHLPASYSKGKANRYPVVYVLDGDENFLTITGIVNELSVKHGNTDVPEMIIVGILNTDRTRDLTITHRTTGFAVDPQFAKNSGGGEKFTSFLKKELIPYIDSAYPAAPYRTLIGHSLGGMIVVNTLLNHTDMFNAYIALDPSIWWDDQLLVKQAETQLAHKKFENKSFFMAVANTMNSKEDFSQLKKDTATPNLHFRSEVNLIDVLKNKEAGLHWSYDYYKNETHASVPLIGQYNGLRFIFDFHPLSFSSQLWNPHFNADSAISSHYKMLSKRMGFTVLPPEEFVNSLGHAYLESHLFDKAEGVFKLNVLNYPNSAVVYSAMGDLYAERKDSNTATRFYQKSLQIKKDPKVSKRAAALASK
jgi:predicted alpha/beta superfamily hydrolase